MAPAPAAAPLGDRVARQPLAARMPVSTAQDMGASGSHNRAADAFLCRSPAVGDGQGAGSTCVQVHKEKSPRTETIALRACPVHVRLVAFFYTRPTARVVQPPRSSPCGLATADQPPMMTVLKRLWTTAPSQPLVQAVSARRAAGSAGQRACTSPRAPITDVPGHSPPATRSKCCLVASSRK